MNTILHGDCLDFLPELPKVKCIIIDPPDNIGLQYGEYKDSKDSQHYYLWIEKVILESLLKCDVFWISYNTLHDLEISNIIRYILKTRHPAWQWKKIIWTYTFGQYTDTDFANNYRPIIRLMKHNCKIYPDQIREESERMKIGDNRTAHTNGRVPGDVWDIPRITGNSYDRQTWHPTQHPVSLYERILKFSCKRPETAVDLCAGSGTIFRAALLADIDVIGIEIDQNYWEKLIKMYYK